MTTFVGHRTLLRNISSLARLTPLVITLGACSSGEDASTLMREVTNGAGSSATGTNGNGGPAVIGPDGLPVSSVGAGGAGSPGANGTPTGNIGFAVVTDDCGNGRVENMEACDDQNDVSGDGCNAACQIELDWSCPPEGGACTFLVVCGDGRLSSTETCDDANVAPGDGCTGDCAMIEVGWQCRVPGRQCVPLCGDLLLTAGENCDDGNIVNGDGCSSTCLTEPGWSCTLGVGCTQSVCGNGMKEAGEGCDLGTEMNGLFYGDASGCSKTCTAEPTCRNAEGVTTACSTACGDANIDAGEDCDDGNAVDGDGCSSLCGLEMGFMCSAMERSDLEPCSGGTGNCLQLPITYRDFDGENEATGHPDFFFLGESKNCIPNASGREDPATITSADCWTSDSTDLCQNLVQGTLGPDGKPVLGADTTCKCRFTDWDDATAITGSTCNSGGEAQPPRIEEQVNVITSAASFQQWYHNDPAVSTTVLGTLELEPLGANQFQFSSSNGNTVYDDIAQGDGTELVSGFFPLEDQPRTKVCNIWPYWLYGAGDNCVAADGNPVVTQWDPLANDGAGATITDVEGIDRNFYFTTEVRYLFRYVGGESLAFFGDDDVWVFINGVLVLDLGAPHERLSGTVTLAPGGADWEIAGLDVATGTEDTIAVGTSAALGLEEGKIYEIAIFHADRHPRESNYQLTVSGFQTSQSTCVPACGDGIRTTGEECDDGALNAPDVYGGCTPECKFGPFCGDNIQNGIEECDLGRDNIATYGEVGCTSACTLPHYCGDGLIDSGYDEQCDDGANNGQSQCTPECQITIR